MADQPRSRTFESDQDLLDFLVEHADDIDEVVIPVQEGLEMRGPNGERVAYPNAGAWIKLCTGGGATIHRETAERFINQGVLQRMEIPVKLATLKADP